MRILFSSTRGTGHLQPLLPYARALLEHGHEILVAGPAAIAGPLREAGFSHAPFGHPGDDTLAPIWARLRGISEDEMNRIVAREIFAGVNASVALPGLLATIESFRPDVIVRESAEFAASVAAEAARVPHACVQVHGGLVEEKLFAHAVEPIDALRQHAGLAPDAGAALRAEPVFTAFPASLDGTGDAGQLHAPLRIRVVDETPGTAAPHWAPDDDGTPLIYITFGTIAGGTHDFRSVYGTALAAVGTLPVRALLTTGPGIEPDMLGPIPANTRVEAWVPQRDVLPHVAALVCHGGSGTVLAALGAGIPLVVVPLFADQPENARRIAAAGAGIALPSPSAAALRAAIENLLAGVDYRRGARKIADELAAMPTIERAVDALVALRAA